MSVTPPPGATEITARALHLEEVPGAEIFFHRAWRLEEAELEVACATRPLPLWLDGLYGPVFGGMNGMVARHFGLSNVKAGAIVVGRERRLQDFAADGAAGRHEVGFSAPDRLMACSTVCLGAELTCTAALTDMEHELEFITRDPTAVEHALNAMIAQPRLTIGGIAVVLVIVVALVLRRRPTEDQLDSAKHRRVES